MGKYKDISGQRFGRLVAISYQGSDKFRRAVWLCKCDCGKEKMVVYEGLKKGSTKSCGCLHDEVSKKRMAEFATKHGGSGERLYWVWYHMKERCEKERAYAYSDYGGRGIKVCPEWHDYAAFRKWALENGYDATAKSHYCTIDRIDVNGDYCPENCRWVDSEVQNNNRRDNVRYDFQGQSKTIPQWAKEYGISKKTVYTRVYRGWSIGDALTVPVRAI